jgi:hypothetical protein
MASMSLCFISQAVLWQTPRWRFELQRGDVVLGLGKQVHGREPARQRQFGGLEDGAADQRAPVTVSTALPVAAAIPLERRVLGAGASRTAPAARPAFADLSTRRCHYWAHRRFVDIQMENVRAAVVPVVIKVEFASSNVVEA